MGTQITESASIELTNFIISELRWEDSEGSLEYSAVGLEEGLSLEETAEQWQPFYGWSLDIEWRSNSYDEILVSGTMTDLNGVIYTFDMN